MYKHETFAKAPITEALIDIQSTFADSPKMEDLDRLAAQMADRFPNKENRFELTQEVRFNSRTGVSGAHSDTRQVGYILSFSDAGQGRSNPKQRFHVQQVETL